MFHEISPAIRARMQALETIDAQDRLDGTPRSKRLRQIPPETGRFLAILLASAPEGAALEIGTSAGYSSLWLALACQATGRRLTTFDWDPAKIALARETIRVSEVEHLVRLVEGDALEHLQEYNRIGFCFLDAEKEIYAACYDAVIPKLVSGGLLVADNAINFREVLEPMLDAAMQDKRVSALVVPIGKGVLLCRKD